MMKSCAPMYKYHPRKIHVRNSTVVKIGEDESVVKSAKRSHW